MTLRILRGIGRDRRTAAMLVVAPIFILWLLTTALGGTAVSRVAVVDDDGSAFSRSVLERLQAADNVTVLHETDVGGAVDHLLHGGSDVVVHLPRGASGTRSVEVIFDNAARSGGLGAQARVAAVLAQLGVQPQTRPAVYRDFTVEDYLAPPLLGTFAFSLTYQLTGVSFLRERVEGTLERIFATPLRRSEFVLGYFVAFGVLSVVQAAAMLAGTLFLLHVTIVGSLVLVFSVMLLGSAVALGLGLVVSTLAENEYQIQQLSLPILMPQVVFAGVLVPVSSLPAWLQPVTLVMPLRYLIDAMHRVVLLGDGWAAVTPDLLALLGFTAFAVGLTVVGVRRGVRG